MVLTEKHLTAHILPVLHCVGVDVFDFWLLNYCLLSADRSVILLCSLQLIVLNFTVLCFRLNLPSFCVVSMLRLRSCHMSKLYSKLCSLWLTDFCCTAQSLCTDSEAVPKRVTSLRRRRSLRSVTAARENSAAPVVTDVDDAEAVYLSRMQKVKQSQIASTNISVDSLKHQLNDAVSIPQPDTELEFPSDILAEQQSEALSRRDQARHAFRPSINPMDTSIVLFPGQGSQFVGMGAKLVAYPGVEKMYKTASSILGYNLLDICLHGPKDVLSKTVNSQPAVLVTSLAAVEKLKEVCPKVHLA